MRTWEGLRLLPLSLSPQVRTNISLCLLSYAKCFTDAGQICTASSRAYVEKAVAERFKEILVAGFKALVQGDPSQPETSLGPQADSTQAQSILRYFEIAKKDGQVLVGGESASEFGKNFIRPTILIKIPETSRANVEEIFGPVLVVHEFESEEEAVRRANDTDCQFPVPRNEPLTDAIRRSIRFRLYERHQQGHESCDSSRSWECGRQHLIPIWRV